MLWLSLLLKVVHLVGMSLAVGAATVKVVLLLKLGADPTQAQTFLRVARPITQQIILGMILLAVSGIGWILLGQGFTQVLVVKLILFAVVLVLGPMIDKVFEPRFRASVPEPGEAAAALATARKQYVAVELLATGLFYAILLVWILG